MQRRHEHGIFQRGSNVREYWLAHCEGFAVVGSTTRSRVRAVVVDPADGRAHHVVVSGRTSLRTRILPAERIESVDPFDRVLYAESRHTIRGSTRWVVGTLAAAARTSQLWLRPRLHAAAVTASTRSRQFIAWLQPRLHATAVTARTRSSEFMAWLQPRLHAMAVTARTRSRELMAWLRPRLRTTAVSARTRSRDVAASLRPWTARAVELTTDAVRATSVVVVARLHAIRRAQPETPVVVPAAALPTGDSIVDGDDTAAV